MTETSERNQLRRLRRRAARLGEVGNSISKMRGGYWLVDVLTNTMRSPYYGGNPITLDEVEAEIVKLETST